MFCKEKRYKNLGEWIVHFRLYYNVVIFFRLMLLPSKRRYHKMFDTYFFRENNHSGVLISPRDFTVESSKIRISNFVPPDYCRSSTIIVFPIIHFLTDYPYECYHMKLVFRCSVKMDLAASLTPLSVNYNKSPWNFFKNCNQCVHIMCMNQGCQIIFE